MSKFDSFVAAFEDGKRQICLDLLRTYPQITVAEVLTAGGDLGKLLGSLTVGEILGQEPRRSPPQPRTPPAARPVQGPVKPAAPQKPAAEAAEGPREVNTRTPAGRAAFDIVVFEALKGIAGPAGAGELQKRVGGTNMQVRTAVNRLIEQGRVTWTGKARGTRYRVA